MSVRQEKILHVMENYREQLVGKVFEEQWNRLKSQYTVINLYQLRMDGIGETLPRFVNMLEDLQGADTEAVLNVLLPDLMGNTTVYNSRFLQMAARYFYVINRENIDFWMYILERHADEIHIADYGHKFRYRKNKVYDISYGNALIEFSDTEKREASEKMKAMKLTQPYVCIHARESTGKLVLEGGEDWCEKCTPRNCDINSFQKAAHYLMQKNIPLVRMGRYERAECRLENCIDYANQYYDELLDFFLLSHCKFIVGSASGLTSICQYFGRAALITNVMFFHFGWESFGRTEHDIIIFKKLWSRQKQRFLNIYEMMAVTEICEDDGPQYENRGIEIVDNTAEEILEAVKEINERIDGVWRETPEDSELQNKFGEIIHAWKSSHPVRHEIQPDMQGCQPLEYRIGTVFLRNNKNLLDCEEYIWKDKRDI